jgi:N-sulfoglucosamine sulfohydrolase
MIYKLHYILYLFIAVSCMSEREMQNNPPNFLFALSDDQSYPHASAYETGFVSTPVFDRIAMNGILFNNAFVAAPQCSPSRAAILTGRNIWQIEAAGTHGSLFPVKYPVFTDILENNGYFIGYTGKGWGPGNWEESGWSRNPAGPEYNQHVLESVPYSGINRKDYFQNFKNFIDQRSEDKPFFFWFGAHEPHREYEYGSGKTAGKNSEQLELPAFLADHDSVRNDLLDYAVEIEWFDSQLGKMLDYLASIGELDNTIVVVTSDNGMPFPYGKANLQEYGTHVPFAMCGPGINGFGTGKMRTVDDLISMIDLAPTFLDLAGIEKIKGITGKSLLPILKSDRQGVVDESRTYVLTGRERHTHARPDNVGYPARAIRTSEYLYIKNFRSDRWPAGDPPPDKRPILPNPNYTEILNGYEDIDDSPTKRFMIRNSEKWPDQFRLGFQKRPEYQLYDITNDPGNLHDLSGEADFSEILEDLDHKLMTLLYDQGDPRVHGTGDIYESYPRFGPMRMFPGFSERGEFNHGFKGNDKD